MDDRQRTALRDAIGRADAESREAFDRMWAAIREGTNVEYQDAYIEWQRKRAYRDGLHDAGFVIEVGPWGDDDIARREIADRAKGRMEP